MNVATEIKTHITRIEELCRYAQEKIDRAAQRKETSGAATARKRKAEQQRILDVQKAESDKNQADQKEAFDERNDKEDKRRGVNQPQVTEAKEEEDAGREPAEAKQERTEPAKK